VLVSTRKNSSINQLTKGKAHKPAAEVITKQGAGAGHVVLPFVQSPDGALFDRPSGHFYSAIYNSQFPPNISLCLCH